jgi:hypothetical protein
MLKRLWTKFLTLISQMPEIPDLDALHHYKPIDVDDDGFCICHGYDCIGRDRPRREV